MAAYVANAVTFNTTTGNKTVAITPAVGNLLVAITANTGTLSTPTVTDNQSGFYTSVINAIKATNADSMGIHIRNSFVTSSVSHTLTMDVGGLGTGGGIVVIEISGMLRAGVVALQQRGAQSNQAAATPAPAFPVAALTGNMCIGAVFNATNPATMTPRTGWTERQDVGYSVPTAGLEVMTRDSGETGTTQTWGSASASSFCSLVIELTNLGIPAFVNYALDQV